MVWGRPGRKSIVSTVRAMDPTIRARPLAPHLFQRRHRLSEIAHTVPQVAAERHVDAAVVLVPSLSLMAQSIYVLGADSRKGVAACDGINRFATLHRGRSIVLTLSISSLPSC